MSRLARFYIAVIALIIRGLARVQRALEVCIKDEPAHWRADEHTLKVEHELRRVK